MGEVLVNKKDEIIMKLVHYFITEQNYTPIVVNGVKDEIWLENSDGPYRIIRINSNYIHNDEQYFFDVFKTKNIVKQIKKKTWSFSVNTLNIFLDLNPDVNIKEEKNISAIKVDNLRDIKKKTGLASLFPDIGDKLIEDTKGIELIVNVTKDINEKTEKENKTYEQIFKKKKLIITPILIALNIIVFLLTNFGLYYQILGYGANYGLAVRSGEIWRLISSVFVHVDALHLFVNMYALAIIGSQIETFVGKTKYLIIYLVSGVCGSLMSILFNTGLSIGASGAIFGLMGALLYFGYHYRLYLGNALKTQIIPLILINLAIGIFVKNIDLAAHVGGLIGGLFITMALGVNGKSKKNEMINGWIIFSIFILFLIILNLFI